MADWTAVRATSFFLGSTIPTITRYPFVSISRVYRYKWRKRRRNNILARQIDTGEISYPSPSNDNEFRKIRKIRKFQNHQIVLDNNSYAVTKVKPKSINNCRIINCLICYRVFLIKDLLNDQQSFILLIKQRNNLNENKRTNSINVRTNQRTLPEIVSVLLEDFNRLGNVYRSPKWNMTSRQPIQTRPTPTRASRFFKRAFTPLPYLGRGKSKRQRVRPPLQPYSLPSSRFLAITIQREFLFSSKNRPFYCAAKFLSFEKKREREKSELLIAVFQFAQSRGLTGVQVVRWRIVGGGNDHNGSRD